MSDFLDRLIARQVESPTVVRPRPVSVFEPATPPPAESTSGLEPQAPRPSSVPAPASPPKIEVPVSPSTAIRTDASPSAQPVEQTVAVVPEAAPEVRPVPSVEEPAIESTPPPVSPVAVAPTPVVSPPLEPAAKDGLPSSLELPAETPRSLAVSSLVPEPRRPREVPSPPIDGGAPRRIVERQVERVVEHRPAEAPLPEVVHRTAIVRERHEVVERPIVADSQAPSLPAIVRQMVLQPMVREVVRESAPAEVSVPEASTPRRELPETATRATPRPPRPAAVAPSSLRPRRQRSSPASPAAPRLRAHTPPLPTLPETSSPTPEIHVSIGRVEVRAVAASEPVVAAPLPRPAVMSLDDYLTQRAGDNGR